MIAILGDFIWDRDVRLTTTRQSPEGDWPVVVEETSPIVRPGGAGAVAMMVKALGEESRRCGVRSKQWSIKERTFVDERQVFRFDRDCAQPIRDDEAKRIVASIPQDAQVLLVADYGFGIVTEYLWEQLTIDKRWIVLVDPCRRRQLEWYAGAAGIVPNRKEAGVQSIEEAKRRADSLSRMFAWVCIKLDKDGMVATDGCRTSHIPASCETVLDVTGAGDQVLAALGVGYQRGMEWFEACQWANKLAGMKCQQHGATPVQLSAVS